MTVGRISIRIKHVNIAQQMLRSIGHRANIQIDWLTLHTNLLTGITVEMQITVNIQIRNISVLIRIAGIIDFRTEFKHVLCINIAPELNAFTRSLSDKGCRAVCFKVSDKETVADRLRIVAEADYSFVCIVASAGRQSADTIGLRTKAEQVVAGSVITEAAHEH